MMSLREILRVKGSAVYTVSISATMSDVVHGLMRHKCGSLVVCNEEQIVGIITERDVLHAVSAAEQRLDEIPVEAYMNAEVITGSPSDDVEEVMGIMTENRVRHLPVLEEGRLAGLVSIGDVVKAKYVDLTVENHYLKSYIHS